MRPFRFGVALDPDRDPGSWAAICRHVEELGYDTLHVPDHVDMPAPLASLVAAAAHTERIMVGTYVLNAALRTPGLLAREAATVDRLSTRRLELGLGAGYARNEFERAGVAWTGLDDRLAHLERTCITLREYWIGERPPPLLIGGSNAATLRLAARHADVVGLTPGVRTSTATPPRLYTAAELDERVASLRDESRALGRDPELNLLLHHIAVTSDAVEADRLRWKACSGHDALLADPPPSVLVGSADEIAEALAANRERFGLTYFTVREEVMDHVAPVISALASR